MSGSSGAFFVEFPLDVEILNKRKTMRHVVGIIRAPAPAPGIGAARIKYTRVRSYGLRCWHWLSLCLLFFISAIQVEGNEPLPDAAALHSRDSGFRKVVDDWISGDATKKESVRSTYGPIENWDVSRVTTMSKVFYQKTSFNDDISKWITTNVKDMAQSKFGFTDYKGN